MYKAYRYIYPEFCPLCQKQIGFVVQFIVIKMWHDYFCSLL